MADYTGIADTGEGILRLLRDALVPGLLGSPDQIGLCPPEDHGDLAVGVWLYDVKEEVNIQMHDMVHVDRQSQRYPSIYLTLYFMITLYLHGGSREHQIMGRIIQALRDQPVLDAECFAPAREASGLNIRLQMQNLPIHEKMRIWTVPNASYRASLFYTAGPVEIRSGRKKAVQRVRDIQYRFIGEQEGEGMMEQRETRTT